MLERRNEARSVSLPLKTGEAGYCQAMRVFPVLKEWEIQIALTANRAGASLDQLRGITPFRQYLGIESRMQKDEPLPYTGSFKTLVSLSENIPQFVAKGIFPTIVTWVNQWRARYPHLNLPVEQFYQQALFIDVPYSVGKYKPVEGATFRTYAVNLLRLHFQRFVEEYKHSLTTPAGYEKIQNSKGGAPRQSKERNYIQSMQATLPGTEAFEGNIEELLDTKVHPQGNRHEARLESASAIQQLIDMSYPPLKPLEEAAIKGMFLYGMTEAELTAAFGFENRKNRAFHDARTQALRKMRRLGKDVVTDVLTGRSGRRTG